MIENIAREISKFLIQEGAKSKKEVDLFLAKVSMELVMNDGRSEEEKRTLFRSLYSCIVHHNIKLRQPAISVSQVIPGILQSCQLREALPILVVALRYLKELDEIEIVDLYCKEILLSFVDLERDDTTEEYLRILKDLVSKI